MSFYGGYDLATGPPNPHQRPRCRAVPDEGRSVVPAEDLVVMALCGEEWAADRLVEMEALRRPPKKKRVPLSPEAYRRWRGWS